MAENLRQADTSVPSAPDERGITGCGTPPPSDDIQNQSTSCTASDATTATNSSNFARRATVGVTGGLITAVGLVMIPAPTPFGCVVAAYGASILATEFEGAQDVLESGKKKLQDGLEVLADKLQENDEYHSSIRQQSGSSKSNSGHPEEEHEEEGEEVVLVSDDDDDTDDEEEESTLSEPLSSSKSLNHSDAVATACPTSFASTSSSETVVEQKEQQQQQSKEDEVQANVVRNENQQEREESDDENDGNEDAAYSELSEVVTGEQDVVQKAHDVWRLHSNNMRKVSIHTINKVLLPALRDLNFRPPTHKTGPSDDCDDGDLPSDDAGGKGNTNNNDDSQRTEATSDETVYAATSGSSEDEEDVPGSAESVVSISTVEDNSPLVVEALQELVEALKEEP